MLPVIEKLLVLQDRDRHIQRLQEELSRILPDRQELQARAAATQSAVDAAKDRVKHLESDRKRLELDVEAKKQLIDKYSVQQFQTRKNEEYKALTHEIDMCKDAITKLDDQQLALMEEIEAGQKTAAAAAQTAAGTRKTADSRLAELASREASLRQELESLQADRGGLAGAVEDTALARYERLLKHKGHTVVVGMERGVCGGCHMQLSRQVVVTCQADQEIVTCLNCGRILYFTPDMDTAVAE